MTRRSDRINITIEFYQVSMGLDNDGPAFGGLLETLCTDETLNRPLPHSNGIMREIKSLSSCRDGSFVGVFAKIQHTSIPFAAIPGGTERDIPLEHNEGIMEKLYFRFYPEFNIMVMQGNRKCGTSGQLASHINRLFEGLEEQILFSPVLQPDSWERLMSPGTSIRKIDLKIAKPSGNQFYPSDDFSAHMLGLINIPGAASLALTLSADLRSRDNESRSLSRGMKGIMRSLFSQNDSNVERARISVESDECSKALIDLMADRLKALTMVTMIGRYPDPVEIRSKLKDEYLNHHEIFSTLFSDG